MQAVSLRSGSFGKRWSPGLATTPSTPPAWRSIRPSVYSENQYLGQEGGAAQVIGRGANIIGDVLLLAAGSAVLVLSESGSDVVWLGWGASIFGLSKLFIDIGLASAGK